MKVRAVDFVGYHVTDLERSVSFYRDTLGLELSVKGVTWAEFEVTPTTIAIFAPPPEGPRPPMGGGAGVALSVDDVGEALEELKGKGVHVVFGPFDSSACYMGVILDPDGNQIFLHRRHDGSAG
jgi:catechol 2,3-dioxygenase-like lactoylglutathione lyase family enzyme